MITSRPCPNNIKEKYSEGDTLAEWFNSALVHTHY